MNVKSVATNLAPAFLIVGLLANIDKFIPGFSVPGAPLEWFAAANACALVAK